MSVVSLQAAAPAHWGPPDQGGGGPATKDKLFAQAALNTNEPSDADSVIDNDAQTNAIDPNINHPMIDNNEKHQAVGIIADQITSAHQHLAEEFEKDGHTKMSNAKTEIDENIKNVNKDTLQELGLSGFSLLFLLEKLKKFKEVTDYKLAAYKALVKVLRKKIEKLKENEKLKEKPASSNSDTQTEEEPEPSEPSTDENEYKSLYEEICILVTKLLNVIVVLTKHAKERRLRIEEIVELLQALSSHNGPEAKIAWALINDTHPFQGRDELRDAFGISVNPRTRTWSMRQTHGFNPPCDIFNPAAFMMLVNDIFSASKFVPPAVGDLTAIENDLKVKHDKIAMVINNEETMRHLDEIDKEILEKLSKPNTLT